MTGMLRRIADHTDPALALRQEMARLRVNAGHEHPYYWAPFILVGLPLH
jgi:CHAT domain-containing protein